ncbi:SlyX family protein [Aliivibrio kagoshimensis]|uniref:SlyX family protein n=1 Tax=Aliivibrio kagoshimensis TaxID=2910230 RepID=UPI003D0A3B8E
MTTEKTAQLESQIETLEYKVAFQEQTVEELNEALSQQQLLITKMQDQMSYLAGKVKGMESPNMADASEETPPPHY